MFTNIIEGSFLDTLETTKWFLAAAYVVSTIGVTLGVYWEGDQFEKPKQQRGWRLLICSLALDTFFTILIFGADGWITHIQRAEIIALEEKLTPRILSQKQQSQISDKLKQFAGTPFAFSVLPDPEPIGLMNQIGSALAQAGWKPVNFPSKTGVKISTPYGKDAGTINSFVGLRIEVPDAQFSKWGNAGEALLNALNAEPEIEASAMRDLPGTEATNDAIVVFIGSKP